MRRREHDRGTSPIPDPFDRACAAPYQHDADRHLRREMTQNRCRARDSCPSVQSTPTRGTPRTEGHRPFPVAADAAAHQPFIVAPGAHHSWSWLGSLRPTRAESFKLTVRQTNRAVQSAQHQEVTGRRCDRTSAPRRSLQTPTLSQLMTGCRQT